MDGIVRYIHCRQCVVEAVVHGNAPDENLHLEIGVTVSGGLVVHCRRHAKPVVSFANDSVASALREMAGRACDAHGPDKEKH